MKYSNFLILLASTLIMACSKSPEPQKQSGVTDQLPITAQKLSKGYKKPGAPIRFASDYSGSSVQGVTQQIKLSFTALADGIMTMSINSKDNMIVGGQIEQSQPVSSGNTIVIPVEILALDQGKYYINIHSRLSSNGHNKSRAFALPVYVGDWKVAVIQTNKIQAPEGNVIIMKAKETQYKGGEQRD